jgi:hypothetical protein
MDYGLRSLSQQLYYIHNVGHDCNWTQQYLAMLCRKLCYRTNAEPNDLYIRFCSRHCCSALGATTTPSQGARLFSHCWNPRCLLTQPDSSCKAWATLRGGHNLSCEALVWACLSHPVHENNLPMLSILKKTENTRHQINRMITSDLGTSPLGSGGLRWKIQPKTLMKSKILFTWSWRPCAM